MMKNPTKLVNFATKTNKINETLFEHQKNMFHPT